MHLQNGIATLQEVVAFMGYATRSWAVVLYRLLVLITGGLLWLFSRYNLHVKLWTLEECPLRQADVVRVKVQPISFSFAALTQQKILSNHSLCTVQFATGRQDLVAVQEQPCIALPSATKQQVCHMLF